MKTKDKKKLAIVSSYDELCGNAAYTKALKGILEPCYNVEIIPLNVQLLRKSKPRLANAHLESISNILKNFDYVNIQFEAGLFGSCIKSIFKNFLKLARSNSRVLLTMHRVDSRKKYQVLRSFYKLGIKKGLGHFASVYANNSWNALYKKVIRFCRFNKIPVLVHSKKDKFVVEYEFHYPLVFDHPLVFYSQDYIESFKKLNSRDQFCLKYGLDSKKIYLGVLGFINKYKGHLSVLESLKVLPDNYSLIVGGAQHPHTITENQSCCQYLKSLLDFVSKNKLESRVHFIRFSSDEDFLSAVLNSDFNILPYLEVGQGGSAVAAIALETKSKSIFTQNLAFLELEKYAPNSFPMFSIGNHLELKELVLFYNSCFYKKGLDDYVFNYNPLTIRSLYDNIFGRLN